jgi:hypothetical protein
MGRPNRRTEVVEAVPHLDEDQRAVTIVPQPNID